MDRGRNTTSEATAAGAGNGSSAPAPLLVQWRFSAQPDAPGCARAIVTSALDDSDAQTGSDTQSGSDAQTDVLLLMVSELVTNAVIHTHRGAELRLIDLGPLGLRVEVEDLDAHLPAQRAHPGAAGGFGLRIIDSFARSWGTSLIGDHGDTASDDAPSGGKIVWFEIDRA